MDFANRRMIAGQIVLLARHGATWAGGVKP
jgi:hypothetical protein